MEQQRKPHETVRRLLAIATIATGALGAVPAAAVTLAVDSYVPTSSLTTCTGGACDTRTSIAAYDPTVITTASPAFGFYQGAFNRWNAGNAVAQRWTLIPGADLGNQTLHLSLAAHATDTINANDPGNLVAGAQIAISANSLSAPNAYGTPTWLNGFTWSQAIASSYVTSEIASRGITAGYYGLDYTTACNGTTVSCGPAYPYQYNPTGTSVPSVVNGLFYDNPEGPYPATGFAAESWITAIDPAARTITAYDGIGWGFLLTGGPAGRGATMLASAADPAAVPEPADWMGFAAALLALLWLRRRIVPPLPPPGHSVIG